MPPPTLSRRLALLGATVVAGAAVLTGAPANASYTAYRTAPDVAACWSKVDAYGGVYQVKNYLRNPTTTTHSIRVESYRPGTGIVQTQTYSAAAGATKYGAVQNVAIVPNDSYRVYLDGAKVVDIPANGVPYYMQHCDVALSSSTKVRSAISYGLSKLDALYVGCYGGTYRYGTVAPADLWHDGTKCGQSRTYFQPKGTIGYDCSGLMAMMFRTAGVGFPWNSTADMIGNGGIAAIPLATGAVRVGDLQVKSGHVRMYLGDGDGDGIPSFIEATNIEQLPNGAWRGVRIIESSTWATSTYMSANGYQWRRVAGL